MKRVVAAVVWVCACTPVRGSSALESSNALDAGRDAEVEDAATADASSNLADAAPPQSDAGGAGAGAGGARAEAGGGAGGSGASGSGGARAEAGSAGTSSPLQPSAACPTPGSAGLVARAGPLALPQQGDGYITLLSNGCAAVQAPATTVVATFVLANPTPYWQNIECWLRSRLHYDYLQSSVHAESSISVTLQIANRGGAAQGDAETALTCRNVENLGHELTASSIELLTESHDLVTVEDAP
jgi:hypothetical protein